jgi:hypothetical protein
MAQMLGVFAEFERAVLRDLAAATWLAASSFSSAASAGSFLFRLFHREGRGIERDWPMVIWAGGKSVSRFC